jgi:hypothetical protein
MRIFLYDYASNASSGKMTGAATWEANGNDRFLYSFNRRGFLFPKYFVGPRFQPRQNQTVFPPVINGWQFLGARQNQSTRPGEIRTIGYRAEPPENKNGTVQFLDSVFYLNESMTTLSDVIPYNSSFWYNGSGITLEAPFLGFNRNWSVKSIYMVFLGYGRFLMC